MGTMTRPPSTRRALLELRLAYHLRCLREDDTDPALTRMERLALVRDWVRRIWKTRQELEAGQQRAKQDRLGIGVDRVKHESTAAIRQQARLRED